MTTLTPNAEQYALAIKTKTMARFSGMIADPHSENSRRSVTTMTNQSAIEATDSAEWEAIEIAALKLDKPVRIAARRQAREELARWIAEYHAGLTDTQWLDGDGHEAVITRKFAMQYARRFAELCSVMI